ncbi:MAG TPA: thiamine diphosphokinase [Fimbriimonadaceae bacterium]|nr:thiamine diphosphokinase [Fimbriimonadaceae bacterium]
MSAVFAPKERVLGVLGGASVPTSLLASWADSATFIAAADGGADALLAAGLTPRLVVGDLDSLQADRALFPDVREDPSEAFTDCDKLLSVLASQGFGAVTLINITGDLPDHELAIFHSAAKSGLACRLVFARGFGHVLVGPYQGRFSGEARVSLLPLSACSGVWLRGVRWPLERANLDALGATSISNHAVGAPIEVELESGAAFLFLESEPEPDWPE